MIPLPSTLALKLLGAAALVAASFWAGHQWKAGRVAIAEREADELRKADARQARQFADHLAGQHAARLTTINNQLGIAREKIARLPGRDCLDPDTVGVLNDIGRPDVGAPAGEPAGAPAAASTGGGLRYSTDRDVASGLAICRARYGEVSSQLNSILDIEDRRFPPAP